MIVPVQRAADRDILDSQGGQMNKQYVIINERGGVKVFLCTGGGAFNWWTPHKSMASKVPEKRALDLVRKAGGKAYEVKMG